MAGDMHEPPAPRMIGQSPAMRHIRDSIATAAGTDLAVLITGETGTGKEIAACAVHVGGKRRSGPMVSVNCAAIPDELFESEVFGHEKGAFTGANRRRIGYFEEARGGTLFLDEIGELTLENQSKLLRVIEYGSFRRVGGSGMLRADTRIVAATNADLIACIRERRFREDLYYRLDGLHIHIPPLRERKEDITDLADFFLRQMAIRHGVPVYGFTQAALWKLRNWEWPGNVRELRSCVERAFTLAAGSPIRPEHVVHADVRISPSRNGSVEPPASMANVERTHIERTLHLYSGNIKATARALGLSRTTLYKKLSDYGLHRYEN